MTAPARATPRGDLSFIETQLPVAKLSAESYSERSAKQSQTLTGTGKWWGRKPLVVCRASLLGLLLPATDNPELDREVFLRLMTMDDEGLLLRKTASIPGKELFRRLPPSERGKWFTPDSTTEKAKFRKGLRPPDRAELQRRVFLSMSYDERLQYCDRPEEVSGPSAESWRVINDHLGTRANNLQGLVRELGQRRFGRTPRVGDSFCGGGSIPFEAARIGFEAHASDLNPVAALLTWSALHLVGGGDEAVACIEEAQKEVFARVDRQVTEWGIEHREPDPKTGRRWRADAYLYCVEATCPECGWRVPLAPSWVIGKGTKTIARLVPEPHGKRFEFEIESDVSDSVLEKASAGTNRDASLLCPHCRRATPLKAIRGDGLGTFSDVKNRLRAWENEDLTPRPDDILGERLYCVRWVDEWSDSEGDHYERHYAAPTAHDLRREVRALELIQAQLEDWQARGYVPSRLIEPGKKTDEPIRTRGWTHWHHLYTPRQLLINGLFSKIAGDYELPAGAGLLLSVGRLADWNSRLCRWNSNGANEKTEQTFSNQALNTLLNFGHRPVIATSTSWLLPPKPAMISGPASVSVLDARAITTGCDLWITDPPYADAVSYEELSELFLAWYDRRLPQLFPGWYSDSRRALAVTGDDADFRSAMVACYRRLTEKMPDNGLQLVMFTHQDASVWADLSLILWAAGLRVTAAWCIATETESALKKGNYVQGTVLLVLRKRVATDTAFLDEIHQEVEQEVRRQLDTMRDLDDARDPSFGDTDYQLAAYAAALRVLTARQIEDIDVAHELKKLKDKGDPSPIEKLIEGAVRIACDHLVPRGLEAHVWKSLSAPERFYLKGLEMESHGETRSGVYQELARGFSLEEYVPLLASTKANEVRLRTATEFGGKEMEGTGFAGTLLRHALFAVARTAESDQPRQGLTYMQIELPDYAGARSHLVAVFDFLGALGSSAAMSHWHQDAHASRLLAGAMRNREDNV